MSWRPARELFDDMCTLEHNLIQCRGRAGQCCRYPAALRPATRLLGLRMEIQDLFGRARTTDYQSRQGEEGAFLSYRQQMEPPRIISVFQAMFSACVVPIAAVG